MVRQATLVAPCARKQPSMRDGRSRQARRTPKNVAGENLTYGYQIDSPSKHPSLFTLF